MNKEEEKPTPMPENPNPVHVPTDEPEDRTEELGTKRDKEGK